MAQVRLTALANSDIEQIIAEIGVEGGTRTAENYVAEFDRLFARLAQYPLSGSPRKALGFGVRIGMVWPYVIIYDFIEADDMVMILRILHGRRDISRRTLEDR